MRDSFAQILNNLVTTKVTSVLQQSIENMRGMIFASIGEKMTQYDQVLQNSLHKILCTPVSFL